LFFFFFFFFFLFCFSFGFYFFVFFCCWFFSKPHPLCNNFIPVFVSVRFGHLCGSFLPKDKFFSGKRVNPPGGSKTCVPHPRLWLCLVLLFLFFCGWFLVFFFFLLSGFGFFFSLGCYIPGFCGGCLDRVLVRTQKKLTGKPLFPTPRFCLPPFRLVFWGAPVEGWY